MRVRRITGMALALVVGILVSAAPGVAQAAGKQGGGCVGRHPAYIEDVFEPSYSAGCSGHDEPELNPLSNLAGSAKDVTWSFVLPGNGDRFPVDAVGPTFWFGGPVTDPDSLFGQAFEELQFYPNSVVTNCTPNGGFVLSQQAGDYTVCSPVWSLTTTGQKPNYHEPAAFNAMLTRDGTNAPLVMHANDSINVHYFVTAAKDGWHIRVTDMTSGQSGLIVLNSRKGGPMMPPFSRSKIGNSLGWGLVHDAPIAFVWEIGHTSPFTTPASQFCVPEQTLCDSYDTAHWLGFSPLQIKSVTFANGSTANKWAVVSDFGGTAEVNQYCPSYGGPFCTYPWYVFNGTDSAFTYGADYPGTKFDYGQAGQFATTMQCGGPFGPDSTYCDTVLNPTP